MSDTHPTLARRLFASVRRERPSAELRERVLALGRAERARMRSGHVQRALPERHGAYRSMKREVGWGVGLAAFAALAFAAVFAIPRALDDPPRIVMSAEQPGASASKPATPPAQTGEPAVLPAPEAPAQPPSSAAVRGSPRSEATRRATPTKADAGPALFKPRSTLAEELEQIKSARAALRAGDPVRTLSLLDVYAARSRGGELGAEASLLRIEALAASGRRTEAARLAQKFAVDHPNSPLIDRALAFANE